VLIRAAVGQRFEVWIVGDGCERPRLAQLEAMAAGRPIINTSLDTAVPHVAWHGIEAITVPPGDPEKLAGRLSGKNRHHFLAAFKKRSPPIVFVILDAPRAGEQPVAD
jgi:glycosyltransferase involved in cell wall biosynthesis